MSYSPRGPLSPPQASSRGVPYAQPGSVRAAKERLAQAQLRFQEGTSYNNQRGDVADTQPVFQYSSLQPQPRTESIGRFGIEAFETDSDFHSSEIRWPLTENHRPEQQPKKGSDPSTNKAARTFFDTSQDLNMNLPPEMSQQEWRDRELASPSSLTSPNRMMTSSSHTSTASSLGSIPDFPFPGQSLPRRSQNIGPPPASRRGQSSYYSQVSLVSPIQEEMDNRSSIRSFASSNVMPASIPDFYLEEGESPSDEDDARADAFAERQLEAGDDGQSTLVRQASLGKRGKPALTTIASREPQRMAARPNPESAWNNGDGQNIGSNVARTGPAAAKASPSTSEESLVEKGQLRGLNLEGQNFFAKDIHVSRPPPGGTDNRSDHIVVGLGKGRSLTNETGPGIRQAKKSTLAERVGSKRPARLNVEAVRDAELRSSLTSLPELIRRATRLAANLDRGKTASRFGPDMMLGVRDPSPSRPNDHRDFEKSNRRGDRGSADAIRPFPPPGLDSNGFQSSRNNWLSNQSQRPVLSNLESDSPIGKRARRRWCGLTPLVFSLVVILIILLIAAAVIIPVILTVLPKRAAPVNRSVACASSTPCQNGASSLLMPDGTCGCLCVNGYTGPKCANFPDTACTTMTASEFKKATVGSQVPHLMQLASSNFSIPLDGSVLLSQFSKFNMSCSAENALVTFSGFATSKRTVGHGNLESNEPLLRERRKNSPRDILATSRGILVAGSATEAALPASTAPMAPTAPTKTAPNPTVVPNSVVPASESVAQPGTNSTCRDFARVGILFVLQDSRTIDSAVLAQQRLSNFITSATKQGSTKVGASNITLGNGYFINLWDMTVTLRNGTQYGDGWNGTATVLQPPP